MVDYLDAERAAQREEFLKREQASRKSPSQKPWSKKPGKVLKPKALTFEQKLELTNQWLEETFPHLFAADDYIPLDEHVLRDLKNEYKNNCIKNKYPQDMVIKAALVRYKENPGYLSCLKQGATRYNLKGEPCGTVTKEEEESAKKELGSY